MAQNLKSQVLCMRQDLARQLTEASLRVEEILDAALAGGPPELGLLLLATAFAHLCRQLKVPTRRALVVLARALEVTARGAGPLH